MNEIKFVISEDITLYIYKDFVEIRTSYGLIIKDIDKIKKSGIKDYSHFLSEVEVLKIEKYVRNIIFM